MRRRKQANRVGARSPGAVDRVSGLALVGEALSQKIPVDEPTGHPLEIPAGHVLVIMVGVLTAAHLQYQEARSRGKAAIKAAVEAFGTEARAAREAARKLRRLTRERKALMVFRQQVVEHLGGRLHKGRFTSRKRLLLTVGVVGGEVALNSAAAYQEGDPMVLAVLSFIGVGAAVAGIGWLGAQLREAIDQHRYGALAPPADMPASLAHTWSLARGWRPAFWFAVALVGLTTVSLGIAVAVLRNDAGSVAIYGVFTAVTVLGATAVSYCGHDPVADLLDKCDHLVVHLDQDIDRQTATIGRFRAARAEIRRLRAEWVDQARAQWDAVLAEGFLQLAHQPHLVGASLPGHLVVLSPEEFERGDWRHWAPSPGQVQPASGGSTSPTPAAAPQTNGPVAGGSLIIDPVSPGSPGANGDPSRLGPPGQ
jgi:hypothetical protein